MILPQLIANKYFAKQHQHLWKTPYIFINKLKKAIWPLFMDGVQLSQGYRATRRRQFTFYHSVPSSSQYSID